VSTSLIGRKLGKYEITALVGKGGMATVYKGYQRDIERYVAIKVLPPHPGQDEQFVDRFRLEARTIARLQHPHILPLYDYGTDDNILYLVMAYVDGGSLHDYVRREPLPLPEVERLLSQVSSALDYAHRQGVVHRDIKPDNILMDKEGNAILADFGIVKILESGNALTVTGGLMGTPAYMAPEQGQGLPVDSRSDLYSLGVVLYEMLAGAPPFNADTPMQLVFKQINAPVPDIRALRPELPAALTNVLVRALAKEPNQRYQTGGALLDDFRRAVQGAALAAQDVGSETLVPAAGTAYNAGTPTPMTGAQTPVPGTGWVQTPTGGQMPSGMMPPPGYNTPTNMQTPYPTIVTQPSYNPLILLVGVVIIGLLVVLLVVVLMTFANRGDQVVTNPTTPPTQAATSPPTTAPTRAPMVNPSPSYGRLSFGTTERLGDTINLRVEGLRQPGSGYTYSAWLMPTAPNTPALKLGELRVDTLGEGLLTYTDSAERNLALEYFAVQISRETMADLFSAAPVGDIVYSGGVPMRVPAALTQILVASPDGFDGGSLLDGVTLEARLARQHSGLAAGATSVGGMQTHAEHTINILRGTREDFNGNGRGENPGRGVGVYFFLDRMDAELNEAANAPGTDIDVQAQIETIRVCILNVRLWVDEVIDLEFELLAAETLDEVEQQKIGSTLLSEQIISGIDLNGNGEVEPFEGECGLDQIATYGIAISTMELRAGALPEAMLAVSPGDILAVEPSRTPAASALEAAGTPTATYDPGEDV
jgi:tRNA A-37 threonylcarbamoyl transferase component Bud32